MQVLDLEGRLQQSTAEHADFKEAAGANLAVIQEQLQRLKGQAGPADTSADQGEHLWWHTPSSSRLGVCLAAQHLYLGQFALFYFYTKGPSGCYCCCSRVG